MCQTIRGFGRLRLSTQYLKPEDTMVTILGYVCLPGVGRHVSSIIWETIWAMRSIPRPLYCDIPSEVSNLATVQDEASGQVSRQNPILFIQTTLPFVVHFDTQHMFKQRS